MLTIRRLSRSTTTNHRNLARWVSSSPGDKIPEVNIAQKVEKYVLTPTQLHNREMRKRDVTFVKIFVALSGCLVGIGYYYLNYIWVDPDEDEEYIVE